MVTGGSLLDQAAAFGPVAWYIFVMSGTPGPNNAMLAASGMNFGIARSLPHMAGIVAGVVVLFGACALGLGVLFQQVRHAEFALAVIGSCYLAYLAWRVANAAAPSAKAGARPLSFLEAFGFQFLNPKGWVMALTAATLAPKGGDVWSGALALIVVGGVIAAPTMSVWTGFGVALARLFRQDRTRVWINRALAVLLLLTIPFMFR